MSNNDNNDYILPRSDNGLQPAGQGNNEAADVIRQKLARLYASEPDALAEEKQAEAVPQRSKHQQFMHELNNSGKSLAQIQTEWHNYYVGLPDNEKHEVWQEFYASNQNAAAEKPLQLPADTPTVPEKIASVRSEATAHSTKSKQARKDRRDTSTVQKDIREHATKAKLTRKQHAQSLLFGLGVGLVTITIFLFSFFNEVIIAPFIQPARTAAATPLIVSTDTVAPSKDPQVIIPKINVQIPIDFSVDTTNEAAIENQLESGIVHYPTTSNPGETGNGAYFGHSSNNIFNKGKYKFAFVLLHELVPGDVFYITKDGKLYAYKVFDKKVVEPSQVEVLNPIAGHPATATLITCDPPGTSLHRLVVVGDQISPDPAANTVASAKTVTGGDANELVGNGKTLWGRLTSSVLGKTVVILLVVGALFTLFRKTSKRD